jgi:hypothetical protein
VPPKEKEKERSAEVAETDDERYLKYTGPSDERIISRADWKSIDIDHDDVSFNRSNGWMVPVSSITDDQALNYFLEVDREFKVEKSAKVRAAAATLPDDQAVNESQLPKTPSLSEAAAARGATTTGNATSSGSASGSGSGVGGSTDGQGGDTT